MLFFKFLTDFQNKIYKMSQGGIVPLITPDNVYESLGEPYEAESPTPTTCLFL